ncbi:MAG: dipeptidase [Anaerolineae bacterium]|nr:dipeptidase [Anaerolineae bacterium]
MDALEQARQLHQTLTVVDAHHDISMDVAHRHKRGERGVLASYWGPRLREGGLGVQVLPVFIEDRYLPSLGLREILRAVEAVLQDVDQDDSVVALATTGAGIDAVLDTGKVAGVLALEGCDGLGGDPALLRLLYRLGVRMVAFTWDRRNEFADGTGVVNPGGLTDAGRAALKDMFAHNVICDVSHLAQPGFWDVIELAEAPIIASHSNAREVCDHRRNLTDEQIRAIASLDGVIGLNFYGKFVDATAPTVERMADHLDHIVKLVGIDHVGIGADFLEKPIRDLAKAAYVDSPHDPSGLDVWIPDCQETQQLPRFTAVLIERGYSRDEIAKVLGENWLRVFREVWR